MQILLSDPAIKTSGSSVSRIQSMSSFAGSLYEYGATHADIFIDIESMTSLGDELRERGFSHYADELKHVTTFEEIAVVVERIRLGGFPELANFISEEAGLYLNP